MDDYNFTLLRPKIQQIRFPFTCAIRTGGNRRVALCFPHCLKLLCRLHLLLWLWVLQHHFLRGQTKLLKTQCRALSGLVKIVVVLVSAANAMEKASFLKSYQREMLKGLDWLPRIWPLVILQDFQRNGVIAPSAPRLGHVLFAGELGE